MSNVSNATENGSNFTESNESNDTSEAEGNGSNATDSDDPTAVNVSANLSELFEEGPQVYFLVERITSGPVWEVHGSKTWDQERQAGEGAEDISL